MLVISFLSRWCVAYSKFYGLATTPLKVTNQANEIKKINFLKRRSWSLILILLSDTGLPRSIKIYWKRGISEKRVQKLMNELNIRSIVRKKYRSASLSKQEAKEYPNLLKCDFSTDKINQKWVTDITYIYTLSDGWCYLSSILDLHSRKIIAWRLSR